MSPVVSRRSPFHDESWVELYFEERLDPKGFRLCRPGADGTLVYDMKDVRRVLYRLPEVIAARDAGGWIVVVEGPKDADTLRERGFVATTNAGGAGKWLPEYTETLRDANVIIMADRDEPGHKHAAKVAAALEPVVKQLLVYEPPAPYKDVTDMIEAGLGLDARVSLDWRALAPTSSQSGSSLRVMSVQELMAVPDADEHDFLLGPFIVKGSRVVVGAYSGHGKTTMCMRVLRAALTADGFLQWSGQGNGSRALVLDVEQGERTVKRRFVEAGLHEVPDKVDIVHQPDGLALDSNSRQVDELEAILKAGKYDIVLADPLYKMHRGDPNDERKAVDLMRQFDAWRQRFGFALMLPMHCRKPQAGTKFSIHDISGSGAFTFGAEVIVGLQRVSNGYTNLYWWKDREGDLGCVHERWGLTFDVEHGFQRDPRDLDQAPLRDRVRLELEQAFQTGQVWVGLEELREATEGKQSSIRKALDAIGAEDNGERLVADRRWRVPGVQEAFDLQAVA